MTKHEFLAALHELLQPKTYLEIGVQAGGSLNLAKCDAIGIDPYPLVGPRGQQTIHAMTSDDFFAGNPDLPRLDLVFIDGMHLFECALRDFMNVQMYTLPSTVVVFDDVLPYNEAIAAREQPPGDWTGDVWKMVEILGEETSLETRLVGVESTGALVVWGFSAKAAIRLYRNYDKIIKKWMNKPPGVPAWVFNKDFHMDPHNCLEELRTR